MIHYTKNEPAGRPPYYTCTDAGRLKGILEEFEDGFYYFIPDNSKPWNWTQSELGELGAELEQLNKPWRRLGAKLEQLNKPWRKILKKKGVK